MELGPFYTGQIPGRPLVITVKDSVTDGAVDLSPFEGAEVKLVDPSGTTIDTEANSGSASILDAEAGTVRYDWPTVSLFTDAGDYTLQLALTGTNINDLTTTVTFEVHEAIGG